MRQSFSVFLLSFFIVMLMTACQQRVQNVELTDQELVLLLFDMKTMKVAVDRAPENIKDSLVQKYRAEVLGIHNLDEGELIQIQKSMQDFPERYDNVYTGLNKLIDSLRVREVDKERSNI